MAKPLLSLNIHQRFMLGATISRALRLRVGPRRFTPGGMQNGNAYVCTKAKNEFVKMQASDNKNGALMMIVVNRVTGERSKDDGFGAGQVRVREKEGVC